MHLRVSEDKRLSSLPLSNTRYCYVQTFGENVKYRLWRSHLYNPEIQLPLEIPQSWNYSIQNKMPFINKFLYNVLLLKILTFTVAQLKIRKGDIFNII